MRPEIKWYRPLARSRNMLHGMHVNDIDVAKVWATTNEDGRVVHWNWVILEDAASGLMPADALTSVNQAQAQVSAQNAYSAILKAKASTIADRRL